MELRIGTIQDYNNKIVIANNVEELGLSLGLNNGAYPAPIPPPRPTSPVQGTKTKQSLPEPDPTPRPTPAYRKQVQDYTKMHNLPGKKNTLTNQYLLITPQANNTKKIRLHWLHLVWWLALFRWPFTRFTNVFLDCCIQQPCNKNNNSPQIVPKPINNLTRCRKKPWYYCLFVLRFYGPVNPMVSCQERSVYLTTHLLDRLNPLSG